MICLPSLDAIREVLFGRKGVVQGKARRLVVNFSTTGGEFMRETAAALAKHRIALLDCPITGGSRGAAAGTLSISVSGTKAHYAEVEPLLSTLAKHRFHVGPEPGQAQTMKLINNLLSQIGTAATYEAFVLGAKAGLDPDAMLEVINNSTGVNNCTLKKMPNSVLPRTFDYGGSMEITYKDITLCMKEADRLGVTMLMGNMARQLWGYGVNHGGAKRDSSTLITYLEEWAGVKVVGAAGRSRT